jgi:parvulin-like peptidyl-prolyl isomerase
VISPLRSHLLRRATAGVLVAVGLSAVASACGTASLAAVTVNGHVITESDLTSELESINANASYVAAIQQGGTTNVTGTGKGSSTFDLAFTDQVLTRQVILQLVHQEFINRKLTLTPSDLQTAASAQATAVGNDPTTGKPIFPSFSKSYQDLLARRAAEVSAVQDSAAGIIVNDTTIQQFYASHPANYVLNCVSVIQLADQPTADQTRTKVTTGGADFAATARTVSTDAQSAANGGDLGCQPVGAFSQVPGVDAAVAALSVGQISPVITVSGSTTAYAIFKLTDRKTQDLATVRNQVISDMQSAGGPQFNTLLMADVAKAHITVNPKYGSWQTSGGNPQIVPPSAPPASAGGPSTSAPSGLGVSPSPSPSDTSQPPVSDTTPAATVPAQAPPTSSP